MDVLARFDRIVLLLFYYIDRQPGCELLFFFFTNSMNLIYISQKLISLYIRGFQIQFSFTLQLNRKQNVILVFLDSPRIGCYVHSEYLSFENITQ